MEFLPAIGYLRTSTITMSPDSVHGGCPSDATLPPLGCTISGFNVAISGWGSASPIVPIGSADGGGGGALVRLGLTRSKINMPMTRRKSRKRIFRLVYFF